MLTGGLAAMVEKAGGINYLLYQIKRRIKNKKISSGGIEHWLVLLIWL
jgi:Na+/H+ antiporter NhaC